MMTTNATSLIPALYAAASVVGLTVRNWASPAWNARIVSAPELSTLIFKSIPCLTKIPFSTPTNSGR